jgi:hypothetical protein
MRQDVHLVVLIHGLDGFSSDMNFISQNILNSLHSTQKIITLIPECNHYQTRDGIKAGSERIIEKIKESISSKRPKYISFVGHSLGGLYARCVVGMLYWERIIPDQVIPVNFITLATPHLGSREHGKVWGELARIVGTLLIGQTGKGKVMIYTELWLVDSEVPFIVELSTAKYTNALKEFMKLTIYANTNYDFTVHYSTAAIRKREFQTNLILENENLPLVLKDNFPDVDIPCDSNEAEDIMLRNLNLLSWNRFAVIPSRIFAHVDIIVKSEFWNKKYGYPVVRHLLSQFQTI